MKKIFVCILTLILSFSFIVPVNAKEITFEEVAKTFKENFDKFKTELEEYAKEYAPKYMKDLTMKSVRNMIRKGITYEDARGILEGISDEELKQLYKEAEKEMAVL